MTHLCNPTNRGKKTHQEANDGVQGAALDSCTLGLQIPQQAYLPALSTSTKKKKQNHTLGCPRPRGGTNLPRRAFLRTYDPALPILCVDHKPILTHVHKEISIKPILCQVTSGTTSKKVPHYLCSLFLTMESHTASNRTVLKLSGIIHEKKFF